MDRRTALSTLLAAAVAPAAIYAAAPAPPQKRYQFGIPELDALLDGGIDPGEELMICGTWARLLAGLLKSRYPKYPEHAKLDCCYSYSWHIAVHALRLAEPSPHRATTASVMAVTLPGESCFEWYGDRVLWTFFAEGGPRAVRQRDDAEARFKIPAFQGRLLQSEVDTYRLINGRRSRKSSWRLCDITWDGKGLSTTYVPPGSRGAPARIAAERMPAEYV